MKERVAVARCKEIIQTGQRTQMNLLKELTRGTDIADEGR